MKPLSNKKRNIILVIFITVFVILFPVLLSYALGYRISKDFLVVRTGGIYIHPWNVRGTVSIDGKEVGETALIGRDYLVQSLRPTEYTVALTRDGYFTWQKTVTVNRQLVTEVNPFIIRKDQNITVISKFLETTPPAAKKIPATNPDWKTIAALFIKKTPLEKTLPTVPVTNTPATPTPESLGKEKYHLFRKMAIWKKDGVIFAEWTGEQSYTPPYFCDVVACHHTIPVLTNADKISDFAFYPDRNDIMLAIFPDGIYAVELDTRDAQNKMPIVLGETLSFRLSGNTLYVEKDPETFLRIELE